MGSRRIPNNNSNRNQQRKNGIVLQGINELSEEQKLQLAERGAEIYGQQLGYMVDHLASLKSLIQDKNNIIQNLKFRYKAGILSKDPNTKWILPANEMDMELKQVLRRKAEALAQRTILENFPLREKVNEMNDLIDSKGLNKESKTADIVQDRPCIQKEEEGHDQQTIILAIGYVRNLSDKWNINIPKEITQSIDKFIDDNDTSWKLQLQEKKNDKFRGKLKKMQDELAKLRSIIQNKENEMENLILQYDLGVVKETKNGAVGYLSPDEIEMEELRRKAERLAQRTILENFELREMIKDLEKIYYTSLTIPSNYICKGCNKIGLHWIMNCDNLKQSNQETSGKVVLFDIT